MKTVEKNVLIVITLFLFGLILALNLAPSSALDKGIPIPAAAPAHLASGDTSSELVSSIDWAQLKQESVAPTF
jgi:hypothetical protein